MFNKGITAIIRFFVFIAFASAGVNAQTNSSLYSRYGIGEINYSPFARNQAMGGVKYALDQPGFINYQNPASYASLWFTTYEAGADFTQYQLTTSSAEHKTHISQVVSYFDFAFPVKPQKWSIGFGLEPYSKVGYKISERSTNENGDAEIKTYQGEGGLNNFHMGTGFRIGKKLSAGFNIEYLFGTIENNRSVTFENPFYMNTALSSQTSVGWFHFNAGVQYRIDSLKLAKSDSIVKLEKKISQLESGLKNLIGSKDSASNYTRLNEARQEIALAKTQKDNVVTRRVKSDWRLVLGFTGSPVTDLRATNKDLVNSFRYYSYALPALGTLYRDTVVNNESSGNIRLPFSAGAGFSLLKGNQWLIASDFSYQQWSDFTFLGVSDSLDNSWRVSIGIQLTPNDRAIKAYHKTMQYRLGFHYEKGSVVLNDQSINDIGISGGFALPVKKGGASLHFTAQVGQRGTTLDNLIRERYLKLTFGLTVNDRWFVREKYD